MLMVRKKSLYDYSILKSFEFIFDKANQKVYSADVGILEVGKLYYLNLGPVIVDRFYCPNVCRVQYHKLGKKSPEYIDLSDFIRLIWLYGLESSGIDFNKKAK